MHDTATSPEALWPEALALSPLGAGLLSPGGGWLAANAALHSFLGFSQGGLLGARLADSVRPDEREFLAGALASATRGLPASADLGFLRGDGGLVRGRVFLSRFAAGRREVLVQVAEMAAHGETGRSSDAGLRELLDSLPFPVLMVEPTRAGAWVDPAARVIFTNRRWVEVLGHSAEDAPTGGDIMRSLYPDPTYRAEVVARRQSEAEGLAAGAPAAPMRAVRVASKSGEELRMLTCTRLAGNRMIVFMQDVTDQFSTELALRENFERNQLASDVAGLGFWDYDFATGLQNWDPVTLKLHGVTRETFTGRWDDYVHPEDLPAAQEAVYAAIAARRSSLKQSFRILRPDGKVRHVEAALLITYHEDGSPARLIGTNLDVTERHVAEEALRENEGRMRLAAEAAGIGFWQYDAASGQSEWDARMLQMFGFSGGDLSSQWEASIHPEDRERVLEATRHVLAEGAREALDYRIVRPDGEVRHIRDLSMVVRDVAGRALRHLGVNIDITDRASAEDALRAANARMRLAAETAGIGFWEFDLASKAQNWDDGMMKIYGLRREEFSGVWEDYIHPDDLSEAVSTVYGAISELRPSVAQTFRIRRTDGSVRHIRAVSNIRFGPEGEPSKIVGVNLDITEQVEADAALRQILENLPVPVACGAAEACEERPILMINRMFTETFGYVLDDIPTVDIWAAKAYPDPAYRKEIMDWWAAAMEQSARTGVIGSREVRIRCKDGSDREVVVSATVLPSGPVLTFQDMTERNRVARALEESRRSIEKAAYEVTENMPSGSYVAVFERGASGEGVLGFRFVSSRFLELLGLAREDFERDPSIVFQVIHPDDAARMRDANDRAFSTTGPFRWEGRIRVGGQERWFSIASNPRRLPDGTAVWEGVMSDITPLKRAERDLAHALRAEQVLRREADILREQAERADKAKSLFLANMSHEVRTPLSALIGLTQAMWMQSEKQQLTPEFASFLNSVRSGGKYLNLVLTNLLDISAAESGRVPLRPEEFYLADWADDLRNILQPIAENHGAKLSWALPEDEQLRFRSDPMRLTQVVLNLAHNAVKFAGDNKAEVSISVSLPGGSLHVAVEDNGPGIASPRIEELFRAYEQSGIGSASYERGVGLGLSVVKLNVGLLGGSVEVARRAPQGMRFDVRIPPLGEQPLARREMNYLI